MKKGLLVVGALAIAIATVPMFAAFEAHVINVTAHIENALRVNTHELEFGTVFPQEYVKRPFDISLSSSFIGQWRLADVKYKIVQKPKPTAALIEYFGSDVDKARAYCHEKGAGAPVPPKLDTIMPPTVLGCYLDLCQFLSKLPVGDEPRDVGHPSYYVSATGNPGTPSPNDYCQEPSPEIATGYLDKRLQDYSDTWLVDLKVPPVRGYVGQDWPASCANYVVPEDSQDYGCDLWVEVTGFSKYCPIGVTSIEGAECTPLPDDVS